jgi:hypothetical protein
MWFNKICGVRYKVLTTASMKMTFFWDVALCSLVYVDRRFRSAHCLHHQGDRGLSVQNESRAGEPLIVRRWRSAQLPTVTKRAIGVESYGNSYYPVCSLASVIKTVIWPTEQKSRKWLFVIVNRINPSFIFKNRRQFNYRFRYNMYD